MNLPTIIVNFKLYEQGTGQSAVELAKIHEKVAHETGASIGVAVSALDLVRVVDSVDIPVFAQHVDLVEYGSFTGHVLPHEVKEIGAYGTLLNHAERQLGDHELRDSIKKAKDSGLYVVACANTPEAAEKIVDWEPDLVAVEPPELIGGDISVSKAGPEIIEDSVKLIGQNKVLVGAGIKDPEDVSIALQLGACGVLLASGVVKSDDPFGALMGLVSGLKKD